MTIGSVTSLHLTFIYFISPYKQHHIIHYTTVKKTKNTIETAERTKLVFGTDVSFDLSDTVL